MSGDAKSVNNMSVKSEITLNKKLRKLISNKSSYMNHLYRTYQEDNAK